MRSASGKGNNARKVLSYYSVNFGISAPYKVLCDGPTIFQSLKNDIFLKQALPALLGGTAYPVVTNCIVSELRSLGEDYSNAALFAKRATRVSCAHDGVVGASECVVARVNTPHEQKLLLATNDVGVLSQVSKTPGIPLIAISNQTKLALKSPSRATLQHVRQRESIKSSCLSRQDRALLEKVQASDGSVRPDTRATKKRKRAKGPNPLSVKKPKPARVKVQVTSQATFQRSTEMENMSIAPSKTQRRTLVSEVAPSALCEKDGKVSVGESTGQNDKQASPIPVQKTRRRRKRKKPVREQDVTPTIGSPESDAKPFCPESDEDHKMSTGSAASRIRMKKGAVTGVSDGKFRAPEKVADRNNRACNVSSEDLPNCNEGQARGFVIEDKLDILCSAVTKAGRGPVAPENVTKETVTGECVETEVKAMGQDAVSAPRVQNPTVKELPAAVKNTIPDGVGHNMFNVEVAVTKKKQRKNRRRRAKKD